MCKYIYFNSASFSQKGKENTIKPKKFMVLEKINKTHNVVIGEIPMSKWTKKTKCFPPPRLLNID